MGSRVEFNGDAGVYRLKVDIQRFASRSSVASLMRISRVRLRDLNISHAARNRGWSRYLLRLIELRWVIKNVLCEGGFRMLGEIAVHHAFMFESVAGGPSCNLTHRKPPIPELILTENCNTWSYLPISNGYHTTPAFRLSVANLFPLFRLALIHQWDVKLVHEIYMTLACAQD